ncbi:MAG: hypothetical protein U5K28_05165 [Halobacteriales archaeon]|nr:hypothetical protein [Halobacteriales archaeon]
MSNAGEGSQARTADLFAVVASVLLAVAVAFTPLGEWRSVVVVIGLPFVLLGAGVRDRVSGIPACRRDRSRGLRRRRGLLGSA